MNGRGETISDVIGNYDNWKRQKDENDELNRKRQAEVANQIKNILGSDHYNCFKDISSALLEKTNNSSLRVDESVLHEYVKDSLKLFRESSMVQNNVLNEAEALDLLSNLVAVLPDERLREELLTVLSKYINNKLTDKKRGNILLPTLVDSDLTESFVRGSGSGGQKINKTANKVVLVHNPTQIRVECQQTRSLQQNRKIARKRMQLKLDEHFNGTESKTTQKIAQKINKKAKNKARNKARRKKKAAEKEKDS